MGVGSKQKKYLKGKEKQQKKQNLFYLSFIYL